MVRDAVLKGVRWQCSCLCGGTAIALTANLMKGHTQSCGCKTRERCIARRKNLVGQKFGLLTVIFRMESRPDGKTYYHCLCVCGKTTASASSTLLRGRAKSCGCLKAARGALMGRATAERRVKNLIGFRFGRLLVLSRDQNRSAYGYILWKCRCDCGAEISAVGHSLVDGGKRSCGCLNNDVRRSLAIARNQAYRVANGCSPDQPMVTANQMLRDASRDVVASVMRRDGYVCQLCRGNKKLCGHHIETWRSAPEKRMDQNNVITLCWECHFRVVHRGNTRRPPDPTVTERLKVMRAASVEVA